MDADALQPDPSPFPRGLLVGSAPWLDDLVPQLTPVATNWNRVGTGRVTTAVQGVDVVVDATALGVGTGGGAFTAEIADAVLAADTRPERIILLIGDEWLGTSGTLAAAAASAAALAVGRGLALRLVASGTTVNAIAVPPGFPSAAAPSTAPIQQAVGVDELVHTLAFFAAPANDYVTGQILSLSGGDTTWSNLSA